MGYDVIAGNAEWDGSPLESERNELCGIRTALLALPRFFQ
jgi:hypothetical protein